MASKHSRKGRVVKRVVNTGPALDDRPAAGGHGDLHLILCQMGMDGVVGRAVEKEESEGVRARGQERVWSVAWRPGANPPLLASCGSDRRSAGAYIATVARVRGPGRVRHSLADARVSGGCRAEWAPTSQWVLPHAHSPLASPFDRHDGGAPTTGKVGRSRRDRLPPRLGPRRPRRRPRAGRRRVLRNAARRRCPRPRLPSRIRMTPS